MGVHLGFINGIKLTKDCCDKEIYRLKISSNGKTIFDKEVLDGACEITDYKYSELTYSVYKNNQLLFLGDTILREGDDFLIVLSNGLGDCIAGIGYLEDFRVRHKCRITCYTIYPELFKQTFPHIEFKKIPHLRAGEKLSLEFTRPYKFLLQVYQHHIPNWRSQPLQKFMTDQLGMNYYYRDLDLIIKEGPTLKNKYVCISTGSTLLCKEWQHETGWGEVCEFLIENGYTVIDCCKNPAVEIEGVVQWKDKEIYQVAQLVKNCEFFIGLSSGISWLAWALKRPVFMISGFSNGFHEFPCYRIENLSVCNGCLHDCSFDYITEDAAWCPRNKKFECSREITPKMVIDRIKKEMKL